MNPADLKIYKQVTMVLNRLSVSTSGLKVSVMQSCVELSGMFAVSLPHATEKDVITRLHGVSEQVKRIPGVDRVRLKFSNWELGQDGSWHSRRR